jgi:hypothetical protein
MVTARADSVQGGSPRPGVIWAEASPVLDWQPTPASSAADCAASALTNDMTGTFDWSKDYSLTWGSEFARNWSRSLTAFKVASVTKPTNNAAGLPSPASPAMTQAAGVVLDRAARTQQAALTSPSANFVQMAFPRAAAAGPGGRAGPMGAGGYYGRGGNCGCERSCGFGDLQTYNYVYNFDDYCDAGSNQSGPQTGNDMWGST